MFLRCFVYLFSFSLTVVGYSQHDQIEFHIAEEGQTLYSVARLYEADIQHIMDCNSVLVDNGLRVGDTVLLDCETLASKDSFSGYHRVQQGETLYSIATMYGLKMQEIMKWNGLTSSGLEVNQLLKVAEASSQVNIEWTETLPSDSMTEDSYLSTEERLFSISTLLGGNRSEGRDTFYIVDYLPKDFALCSPSFSRDSSLYKSLGIAAVSFAVDTIYEWVDLHGVCYSNRHEISRALAETLRPLNSEDTNPWIILSWQLVVLDRTLAEE